MRAWLLAGVFALSAGCAPAVNEACPGEGEWAAACFETSAGTRQLKPQYRSRLATGKSGVAVIAIAEPREMVAVDRRGVVIVPGIFHTGDFDYPTAEQDVARFQATGKCGFFSSATFKVLVAAEFDQCRAFREGEAIACKDCKRYCTEDECKDSKLVGGQGFAFDAKGKLLRQFALPGLEAACGRAGVAEVENGDGASPRLKCKKDPNSPFKM
jgi:hypothetical protein